MHSMTHGRRVVVGGVDAHADTHHAAALDERGALLGTRAFATTPRGLPASCWRGCASFGAVEVVGVESTGCLRRRARALSALADGVAVVEVNQPHAHTRRRRGKSDPIDAEMAARHALAGKAGRGPQAHRPGSSSRSGSCASRATERGQGPQRGAWSQLAGADRHRARASCASSSSSARRSRGKADALPPPAARPERARTSPSHAAKLALRSLARRIDDPRRRDRRPRRAARAARPQPPRRAPPRCSGSRPATPASCSSPPARTSSASAAMAPSPRSAAPARSRSSSGTTDRHRLNYGGDRDANRALHMIAVCRLRYCDRTRAYAAAPHRRGQDQARDHPLPQALHRPRDLPRPHAPTSPIAPSADTDPRHAIAITCGAGPIGTQPKTDP